MKRTTIHCVTLAVDDLQAAYTFYRDGLGLVGMEIDAQQGMSDHIAIELPGKLYLVLVRRSDYNSFTRLAEAEDAPPRTSECILSYFASSKEDVDAILARARAAGGTGPEQAAEQEWGYAGFVKDPDGHVWEVVWNAHMSDTLDEAE